jgi:hypothetical protein
MNDADVLATLDRHATRRRAGLPTASVLVGPADATAAAWLYVAGENIIVHCHTSAPDRIVQEITAALDVTLDLGRLALAYLSNRAGLPVPPLHADSPAPTARDLEQLSTIVLSDVDAAGAGRAAVELCRLEQTGKRDSDTLAEVLDAALTGGTSRPRWRVLQALDGLLPSHMRPWVLFLPSNQEGEGSWLAEASICIAQMTETVPAWPVGVAVSTEAFDKYREGAPESRAKSLLESGRIIVEPVASGRGAESCESQGSPFPTETMDAQEKPQGPVSSVLDPVDEVPPAVAGLADVTPTPALKVAYADAARLRPRQDDAARSAAERFLFELLESHATTRGHFVLNGDAGFAFGPRAAEIDLLAMGLRLAVEVDGYYHFTDPDGYRRDRRKDWELQRRGFVIVRVLADDVVDRTQEVLDAVIAAVEHRRREHGGT